MEKSPVPPPEPTLEHKSPSRTRRRFLRVVLPFAAVIVVIIAGLLFADQNSSKHNSSLAAHLLIDNSSKNQVVMAAATGKQLYSLSYPKFSYLNFEAASTKGEVLLSQGISTSSESYIFIVNGKSQNLPKPAVQALRSAIVVNNSHQLFFSDENTVIYISCPSGSSCKLMSVDLTSGKTTTIADTGVKPVIPQLPAVYPLGVSADRKTIYLRTMADNKLGKTAAGVYAVDLSGKVTKNWALPLEADYTPRLSPDGQQVAYKTPGDKNAVKISVLNLNANKTYSANWTKGAITDQIDIFTWSPDSKKVFFWGSDSIMPRPKADSTFDINLAYLDVAGSKINYLQTIKDSAHNMVGYHAWLDNSDVIYEQDSATQAYVFDNPTPQIYKQNISSKAATKLDNLSGKLLQTVFY